MLFDILHMWILKYFKILYMLLYCHFNASTPLLCKLFSLCTDQEHAQKIECYLAFSVMGNKVLENICKCKFTSYMQQNIVEMYLCFILFSGLFHMTNRKT